MIISFCRFTVLKSARPVTLRAEYGPFMTRQTVPTQYFVPNLSSSKMYSDNPSKEDTTSSEKANLKLQQSSSVITDFKSHQMDLSAHLVTKEVIKVKSFFLQYLPFFQYLQCYFYISHIYFHPQYRCQKTTRYYEFYFTQTNKIYTTSTTGGHNQIPIHTGHHPRRFVSSC